MDGAGNGKAALLMLAAMATFCANDAVVKLVIERVPIGEVMALRGVFVVAFMWLALPRLGLGFGRPERFTVLRSLGEACTSLAFLTGLALLPLADSYTLYFTAPIMLTLASALFMGERVGPLRWLVVVLGFVGVVVVVGPPSAWSAAILLPLLAAALSVGRDLATRRVPPHVGSGTVALATAALVALSGLLTLPLGWVWPTAAEIGWCAFAAFGAGAGYVFMVLALRLGELSFVAPFRYGGIPVAILLQLLVWGDVPGLRVLAGSAVIVVAGLLLLTEEHRAVRGPATVA